MVVQIYSMCTLEIPASQDLQGRCHRLTDVDPMCRSVDWLELMLELDLRMEVNLDNQTSDKPKLKLPLYRTAFGLPG